MTKEDGAGWWNDPDRPHYGQMVLERRKSEIKQLGGREQIGEKKLKPKVKGTSKSKVK